MEEWIGLRWHRLLERHVPPEHLRHPAHAVTLEELRKPLELLLHAGGTRLRVGEATPVRVGGTRTRWQRVAGFGARQPLPQRDAAVLALPPRVALYDELALNRDLYLWWAAMATGLDPRLPWAEANRQAQDRALMRFPGLAARLQRLNAAEAARRGQAFPQPGDTVASSAPVWTWLVPVDGPAPAGAPSSDEGAGPEARRHDAQRLAGRRRARPQAAQPSRTPLLLAAKGESLKTFADPMAIDRAFDDEDDGSAVVAAEELEELALKRTPGAVAARVRFDLDLPSASADDLPVGVGEWLPEWNLRTQALEPQRVLAQRLVARDPQPWNPPAALRVQAARVRRQLESQRAALRWQRATPDGEDLDLDAWVRHRGEAAAASRGEAAVYQRRVRGRRDLATLLLADLSLSTDAYATHEQRIIEVIRDALFVFGEALHASGDAWAMTGFSSVRRQLRLHDLKRFDEPWSPACWSRLGALKPGYYTRMGAALRAGTRALAARPERQKLLLLLTDGKPHDLDHYEGRAGVEDTRQAVREARRAGLIPFAVSIDAEAGEVLPGLFGSTGGQRGQGGWAWVRRPQELAPRLSTLYAQLMR